jgi:hypothetical protein
MNTGYGPPIGKSPEGFPVYLYTDPASKLRTYVVVLPDGRAFYSDMHGQIVCSPVDASQQAEVLAIAGGLLGFLLGGGPGALLGGAIGAVLGQAVKKRAE